MPPLPRPHRVTFLPPIMTLGPGDLRGRIYTEVLGQIVFHHLAAHPVLAITDPDDRLFFDPNGFPLDANHPELGEIIGWETRTARREEVLWLELTLVPGASAMPRLHCRSFDGNAAVFTNGGDTFAGGLAGAIAGWLEARFLPPPPVPLVAFTADDVRDAAVWIEKMLTQLADKTREATIFTSPPVAELALPTLRALERFLPYDAAETRRELDDMLLDLEPDHPTAARDAAARRLAAGDTSARADIQRLITIFPQQGRIHLLWAGDDLSVWDELRHQSIAATLMAESPLALDQHASALLRAGRPDDAHRSATRAARVGPRFVKAHCDRVRALRMAERPGEAYREARAGWNLLGDLWSRRQLLASDESNLRWAQHLLASVHLEIGRLDEAIAIARRALDGAPTKAYRTQRAELEAWENQPAILAAAYARDGHFRREPGRVLDGFARGRPLRGHDVAVHIEALIATGKDDLTPLCWAHHDGAHRARTPAAWLAGARACLLGDELEEAIALVQRAQLGAGAAPLEGAVHRFFRLAAIRPVAEWEAILAGKLDAGAKTVARLLARDLADFVPGLETSEIVREALGPRAGRAFESIWLAPLRAALGDMPTPEIDAFFTEHAGSTLTAADRLAGRWLDRLAPSLPEEARAGQVAYVFASALARYFVLTTGAPNPLAGGLRQVAADALALLGQSPPLPQGVLRAVLEVLDAASEGVDPWVLDRWILRFERAVVLEDRLGGHLTGFTAGLRRVGDWLRGEERIAFELRLAHELKDDGDPTNDDQARALFERSLRAVGASAAAPWAEVTSGLPPATALDVLQTAAAAAHHEPGPHLALARAFLTSGRSDRALAALLVGLPLLELPVREQRLAELKPHWQRSGDDLPFEWAAAQDAGLAHLAAGRARDAARCFAWCNALDPGNPGILKNLGLAWAALGETTAAVRAFAEMDEADGPKLAGHALLQAQKYGGAVRALRYASATFTDAADWATLGGAAWYDEDDETAAEAYEKVYARKPGRLAAAELATFATALANAGLYARCEEIARELIAAAFDDQTFLSAGNHAMARALLGQGRAPEAVSFAQLAVVEIQKGNPSSSAAAEMAETLARARRNQPYPTKALRRQTVAARAFAALEAGDFPAAQSIAISAPGWATARAALVAGAVRSDPHSSVGYPALHMLATQLDGSAGATDRDSVLWRDLALALREDAYFPTDPPPPLGRRVDLAELDRLLSERMEDDEPTIMKELPSAPTLKELGNQPTHRLPHPEPPPVGGDDLIVFPGTKIPRLSDYVEVMKAMKGEDPLGALAKLGLDMAGYAQLASQWGQRLAQDPELSARFSSKMAE